MVCSSGDAARVMCGHQVGTRHRGSRRLSQGATDVIKTRDHTPRTGGVSTQMEDGRWDLQLVSGEGDGGGDWTWENRRH